MPKFPEPPAADALIKIGPVLYSLPAGTALARIFSREGSHPVFRDEFRHWGPTSSRFDHHFFDGKGFPKMQDRGIFYAARNCKLGALAVCAAEYFQASRIIDTSGRDPWFTSFETTISLNLLDIRSTWPTRAGASSAISSGSKARAQRWSKAIYETYPEVHGVLYPSSMGGGEDVIALYERAKPAMPRDPVFHRSLRDPALKAPYSRQHSTSTTDSSEQGTQSGSIQVQC